MWLVCGFNDEKTAQPTESTMINGKKRSEQKRKKVISLRNIKGDKIKKMQLMEIHIFHHQNFMLINKRIQKKLFVEYCLAAPVTWSIWLNFVLRWRPTIASTSSTKPMRHDLWTKMQLNCASSRLAFCFFISTCLPFSKHCSYGHSYHLIPDVSDVLGWSLLLKLWPSLRKCHLIAVSMFRPSSALFLSLCVIIWNPYTYILYK